MAGKSYADFGWGSTAILYPYPSPHFGASRKVDAALAADTSGSRADFQVGIKEISAIFRTVRVAMSLTPDASTRPLTEWSLRPSKTIVI
jgi:hypothetical protein